MRKDQIQKLHSLENIIKDQPYLLAVPESPQQTYLHLIGHRILVKSNMFHKNFDKIIDRLEGTFAQSFLKISYITTCIENQVDLSEDNCSLVALIQNWVNLYPSIKSKKRTKCLINNIIEQGDNELLRTSGFQNYITYLNLISIDLWKLLKYRNNHANFFVVNSIKNDLKEWYEVAQKSFDVFDLLTFADSCIPKTLINIILDESSLPPQIAKKTKSFQCLYSNKSLQFYLRTSINLSILLKHILLILLTMNLSKSHQKTLMQLAMRYFFIYHSEKKYCATEIVIYSFNKISENVRVSLQGELSHFFKISLKLGKHKFINFVSNNSNFVKTLVEKTSKSAIGYNQQSISPYNSAGIADTINIEQGSTATRYFEILQDYSLFYFRIEMKGLDINVNLYYLGDFTSAESKKILLFKHQKVWSPLKNCVNALKKGLYMFEFDNTYSWINNKVVFYENQIFTPLGLKQEKKHKWIDSVYDQIPLNSITNPSNIISYSSSTQQSKQQSSLKSTIGGYCYVQKKDELFRLKINKFDEQYIYQTDNAELMKTKVKKMHGSKQKYQWKMQSNTNIDFKDILRFIDQNTEPSEQRQQSTQKDQQLDETKQNLIQKVNQQRISANFDDNNDQQAEKTSKNNKL